MYGTNWERKWYLTRIHFPLINACLNLASPVMPNLKKTGKSIKRENNPVQCKFDYAKIVNTPLRETPKKSFIQPSFMPPTPHTSGTISENLSSYCPISISHSWVTENPTVTRFQQHKTAAKTGAILSKGQDHSMAEGLLCLY